MDFSDLALDIHRIGAVRFGEFRLKDGSLSPFYIDLRLLVANPDVLKKVGEGMAVLARSIEHECVAGIPYAGLPIAVALSLASGVPLIYPRKERKEYGTGRLVEGVYSPGDRALVIDDVITSGGAKVEAIAVLRNEGLTVNDVMVVVDREGPGTKAMADAGLRLHSLLRIRPMFDMLATRGAITAADHQRALDYLSRA